MKDYPEDYSRYIQIGLISVVIMLVGLTLYAFAEGDRLVSAAEEFNSERVQRGKQLYAAQCQPCHGGEGQGGTGPALNSKKVLDSTPDSVFFSVIRSGVPNTQMPAWSVEYGGPLTDEDVRDIVALIRSWQPTAPEISQEAFVPDPGRGAVLFASTCAVCHGEDGAGTEQAPTLNDPARLEVLPDEWYRGVIKNGRPAKGMPTWGTVLSPEQIDDLVSLIAAWREGSTVAPSFSVGGLLDQAIFALQNDDNSSASLNIARAVTITDGTAVALLESAEEQIASGEPKTALATLQDLRDQWPLGDPANGASVYSANCAPCHGIQGEGGVGVALNPNTFVQSSSNAELVGLIQSGRDGTLMAAFEGRLTGKDMADVVAFLRLWQK
jgi:mono/diheme cytochrome c family protein